jgi:hypothetical protein
MAPLVPKDGNSPQAGRELAWHLASPWVSRVLAMAVISLTLTDLSRPQISPEVPGHLLHILLRQVMAAVVVPLG